MATKPEQAIDAALDALDPDALVSSLHALVSTPSVTGEEGRVMRLAAVQAAHAGLRGADTVSYDLKALRADPDHPGEETDRTELINVRARLDGATPDAPVLALCAHLDVTGPGTVPWRHGSAWSGTVEHGCVHGRGSVDMKAGFSAALSALKAIREAGVPARCAVELLAVSSQQDGGLGAFAALREDAGYAACVIPEPTEFDVVCAQAGAVTFTGVVHGEAAHAARRRSGASAIDRYLPVHQALQRLEAQVNTDVDDPLMAALDLPYPVSVGRIEGGDWASSVPDRLQFEGRAPVRIGQTREQARALVERAVAAVGDGHVDIRWTGGQFAAASTPADGPLVSLVGQAATVATGQRVDAIAATEGTDMRHFVAWGIPTVMCGTPGAERAHAVDEHVVVDDVLTLTETLIRVVHAFGE